MRARGRDLDEASELRRDGPRAAEPCDGVELAEVFDVPLRERNTLLVAAGFAPAFKARALDDPELAAAQHAVEKVLRGHEPYPALAVDRHWTLLAANRAVPPLLAGASTALATPPVNVLRLSLHPDGLAPRITNLNEWRAHVFARLRRQIDATADETLSALLEEFESYPSGTDAAHPGDPGAAVVVPFRLATDRGLLSFISTTTLFGTPMDITLAELAIESFFPADERTAEVLGKR